MDSCIVQTVLNMLQIQVTHQKIILDLEKKIDMLIQNSSQGKLEQQENLLSKKGHDREGTKQNHFYAQVRKDPDALHQTLEKMSNEENFQEEEPLTSDEESELDKRMLVTEVVNLGTERPSKIANIKKVSLKQHENLLGKNGQDREGMKQNHFYAQVHTNPDALCQTHEAMSNEENPQDEDILTSNEESRLEKRMLVPKDEFGTERPSKRAKIKKLSDIQVQIDSYALYQTIKEMFKEENWQEGEILTSGEEIEFEKGNLVAEDIFEKDISSKSAKIKKVREVVQEKRVLKMNHIINVENEKEREIRGGNKALSKNYLQGWHSNDDIYMRQSIIMIIIKMIEHLQPNANNMVDK